MKAKMTLSRLVVLGITSGILLSQHDSVQAEAPDKFPDLMALAKESNGNITYHLMTADELELELTDEGSKLFKSLSPEGQTLALQIASRSCDHTNECRHQNACKTKNNDCAGQGECKGTTKCAVGDKNLAVRLAANIMAEKREGLDKPKAEVKNEKA